MSNPSLIKSESSSKLLDGNDPVAPRDTSTITSTVMVGTALFAASAGLFWAYWPTLAELARTWDREPDYSHGFLVFPASILLLWSHRTSRPTEFSGPAWAGIGLIAVAAIMRFLAAKYFISAIDAWSIPVVICGLIWLICGKDWIQWSWPAISFLVFMVPLPWRVESLLSSPLQHVATTMSAWGLQALGFPAVQQGNIILLGDISLEVEKACSGLRMLLSVTALAFGYLILRTSPWWQRSLILIAIIPIALVSNAVRIITTGVLFKMVSSESAQKFSHDFAGWIVIPVATTLLYIVVCYIQALVIEYEVAPLVRRRD